MTDWRGIVRLQCQDVKSREISYSEEQKATIQMIMEQAVQIQKLVSQDVDDDVSRTMFSKCEANLQAMLSVRINQEVYEETLESFAEELQEQWSPSETEQAFKASFAKRKEEDNWKQKLNGATEIKRLKALARGSAVSADDPIEDEEDVVVTQKRITNFKCPILQVDMQPEGDLRPVFSTACKGKCTFSWKGISNLLKMKKSIKCPHSVCDNKALKASDLRESKEMLRALKDRAGM